MPSFAPSESFLETIDVFSFLEVVFYNEGMH